MIYDHISNIPLYKGLSSALDTALDFIAAVKAPIENGTIILDHDVKAIVSEYVTRPVPEPVEGPAEPPMQYEAHIQYADIQFLISGSEDVKCCPLQSLEPSTDYDEARDCRLYIDQPGSGCALRLGSGFFAILFPSDAHMPQLAVGEPEMVKKVVMKVPMG